MDEPTAPAAPGHFTYLALVLVSTATIVLVAGVINVFAFVIAPGGGAGTAQFRALADAAPPFTALVLLAAIVLVTAGRRDDGAARWPQAYDGPVLAVATVASLVALLFALNGVVVAFMGEAINGAGRLAVVLYRTGTVVPAGFALWLAATAPARRGSRPAAVPPLSPPGDPGRESPP